MMHALAEKRCPQFGTCANGRTGAAKANTKHLAFARQGRDKILAGDCFTVQDDLDGLVDQMTIPLIQGMLKYAYKADPANNAGDCSATPITSGCEKAWAEGWAFAAAVLPRLNYCSTSTNDVAAMVKSNLDVAQAPQAQMADGFATLKTKVESLYPCL